MSTAHTIVVGDTHMYWPAMLKALHHFRPEVCVVAGDFGWWPETWGYGPLDKRLAWLMEQQPVGTERYLFEIRHLQGIHIPDMMLTESLQHLVTMKLSP